MTGPSLATPLPRERSRIVAIVAACVTCGALVGLACALVDPLYLLALVPIVVVGAWTLRSPEHGLLLTIAVIALIPRVASPVSIGFKPTVLDAALVLTFAAWLFRRRAAPKPMQGRALPIALPLLALIAVALATFVAGIPNGALTTLVIRRFAEMVGSLAMVWVFAALLRERGALRRAVQALVVLGAAAAVAGIVLYALNDELAIRLLSALRPFAYPSGPEVLRFVRDDPSLLKRATGLWIDPNAFGGFLLMVGALGLAQAFSRRPVISRGWGIVCMALIGLALLMTVSRAAILGLAGVALLLGVVRYRALLPLLAASVVVMLVLPQTQALVGHFLEGFAGRDLATQMRFGEYKDAFRLIERYPVFGVGFADTPDVDLYIGVSSMYLLIAQQMGLTGLAAFLGVMIGLAANAVRTWPAVRDDDEAAAIWLGAHAAIAGALAGGVLDHYFFNIDFHNSVMLFWLIVSIALAASPADQARPSANVRIRYNHGHASQRKTPQAS